MVFGLRCHSVCVASTWVTSVMPMPKASAPERAVGGGVAVAADDQHAGLADALLRSDDVDDALAPVVEAEQSDARGCAFSVRPSTMCRSLGVADLHDVAGIGGDVMIGRAENARGHARAQAALAQKLEGRRVAVVDQMAIDVEQVLAVGRATMRWLDQIFSSIVRWCSLTAVAGIGIVILQRMQMPKNEFKAALRSKALPQIGLWAGLADPVCAEICAGAGFDWLLIDGEHAPNDVRTVMIQLQAVAPYPAHPVVRPLSGDVNLIKQLLDVGAQTLLIPMVESAEQARHLVSAMRYPPDGDSRHREPR